MEQAVLTGCHKLGEENPHAPLELALERFGCVPPRRAGGDERHHLGHLNRRLPDVYGKRQRLTVPPAHTNPLPPTRAGPTRAGPTRAQSGTPWISTRSSGE